MTAFVPSDIPASVNTVEELAIWSLTILNELFPNVTVTEAPGRSNRAAECSPFYLDSATPPGWYTIGRLVVPMQSTWRQSANKPWATINELGTTAIPAGYKS
uniref:Uncharacterized protein n=1 Tax=Oscillatoriales cyanobacterium SpSt-402 TaxID=2282168 RepID=A0A832M257_9CYAN